MAARVGAHYFLADRIRMVIEFVRQALGYRDSLPWAFLSILGLVVNPVLALLSIWFSKVWKDDRLAKHCHYIGVPLAIAACLYSGFEPLAGAICLSGYTVLFALAIGIFAAPAVSFLTIFALTGAAYFWSSLIPGVTIADQAMLAAALAWGCWGICQVLRRLEVADVYATPLDHGRSRTPGDRDGRARRSISPRTGRIRSAPRARSCWSDASHSN